MSTGPRIIAYTIAFILPWQAIHAETQTEMAARLRSLQEQAFSQMDKCAYMDASSDEWKTCSQRSLVINLQATALYYALGGLPNPCREVENDLDRLACFDLEYGRTPVAEVVETPASSAWDVSVSTSDMTDQTTVVMRTTTDGSITCGFSPRPATLILRCSENTTALYISTNCQMTSNLRGYGDVTYRFDDTPAQTRGFTESSDSSALGLWNGGKSIPFIKKMFGKSAALFRFTPYGDSPTTARFDITGLEDAVAPLREACHW